MDEFGLSAAFWMLAAIGSTIGFDRYAEAIAMAVATVVVLAGIQAMENLVERRREPRTTKIEIED